MVVFIEGGCFCVLGIWLGGVFGVMGGEFVDGVGSGGVEGDEC